MLLHIKVFENYFFVRFLTDVMITHKAAYSIKRSKTGKLSGKLRIQFVLTSNDRADDDLQPFPKTNRVQSPPTGSDFLPPNEIILLNLCFK